MSYRVHYTHTIIHNVPSPLFHDVYTLQQTQHTKHRTTDDKTGVRHLVIDNTIVRYSLFIVLKHVLKLKICALNLLI